MYKVSETYSVPYNSTIKTTIIFRKSKKGNSTNTTIVSQLKPDGLPSSLNTKNWKFMAKWWHGLTQTYSWIPEIMSLLIRVMAWRQSGAKSWPKPMRYLSVHSAIVFAWCWSDTKPTPIPNCFYMSLITNVHYAITLTSTGAKTHVCSKHAS